MTRSEERLQVGTQEQETGRARLRKYVVTENVTQTVPVRKEKAVLEREAITDENFGDATSGPDISEDEHEVTLHEERPVVGKTTEPVERVRLATETETDQKPSPKKYARSRSKSRVTSWIDAEPALAPDPTPNRVGSKQPRGLVLSSNSGGQVWGKHARAGVRHRQ